MNLMRGKMISLSDLEILTRINRRRKRRQVLNKVTSLEGIMRSAAMSFIDMHTACIKLGWSITWLAQEMGKHETSTAFYSMPELPDESVKDIPSWDMSGPLAMAIYWQANVRG